MPKKMKKTRPNVVVSMASRGGMTNPHDELEELDENTVVAPSSESPIYQPASPKAGESWVEAQYASLAREQVQNHRAEGEVRIAPHRIALKQAEPAATGEEFLIDGYKPIVTTNSENYELLTRTLLGVKERTHKTRNIYHGAMAVLMLGDVVGVSAGAMMIGENPIFAVMQGVAAGGAAVVAGLMGAEIKRCVLARNRQWARDEFAEVDERLVRLVQPIAAAEPLIKLMSYGAFGIGLLLSVSVFALRYTAEGFTQGLVFALLALAIAGASWVNAYIYADPLAEVLEAAHQAYTEAEQHFQVLLATPARATVAANKAAIVSIRRETRHRARAASQHVMAHLFGLMNHNVGVFGHGRPSKALRKVRRVKWEAKLNRRRYGQLSPVPRTQEPSVANGNGARSSSAGYL